MIRPEPEELGDMIGLIVHDLRNPGATISANVAYVQEVLGTRDGGDLAEALQDVASALDELMRGLDQVSWIGHWLRDESALSATDGDVLATVRDVVADTVALAVQLDLPEGALRARGGGSSLGRLLRVLLSNSAQHAPDGAAQVEVYRAGSEVVVKVRDRGLALAPDLRARAFTAGAQRDLKGRRDGRYGRVVGLFAAQMLADAMGVSLAASGEDGAAVFRVGLAAL